MSASGSSAVTGGRQASLANLTGRKFAPGPDPRRSAHGPLSSAEVQFKKLLEDEFIPQAADMLRDMIADTKDPALSPDTRQKARMDFLKCCGLIKKPTDAATIHSLAEALVKEMLEQARAARTAQPQRPIIDCGTEE